MAFTCPVAFFIPLTVTMVRSGRRHDMFLRLKAAQVAADELHGTRTRKLFDIRTISYPDGINGIRFDLDKDARHGLIRYDRDFLLQFMPVCKDKPRMITPLETIGLVPNANIVTTRGGLGRHRQGTPVPPRQGSIGAGSSSGTFSGKASASNPFGMGMGHFATPVSKLSSEDRFAASGNPAVSVSGTTFDNRLTPVTRTVSQGGGGGPMPERTRPKRGEDVRDPKKSTGNQNQGGHGGYKSYQQRQQANLEPVAPLQVSENRWDRKAIQVDPNSPEMAERKVKGLLNKLTMKKFDSISDQIIQWANKSENETDGRTLKQVIRLVFEEASADVIRSEMYATLCKRMMQKLSRNIQDEDIKNVKGEPVTGGDLFHKYLRSHCRNGWEDIWVPKETDSTEGKRVSGADARLKSGEDGKDEFDTPHNILNGANAMQKVTRQGLGLIKFNGELFKQKVLSINDIREYVRRLLLPDNPDEKTIELLCMLLSTVGSMLDSGGRTDFNVYISRMKEWTKDFSLAPRMRKMLIALIELRERKWVTPTSISGRAIARSDEMLEIVAASSKGQGTAARHRGDTLQTVTRDRMRSQLGIDGWVVAGGIALRAPSKADDLSNYEKNAEHQPISQSVDKGLAETQRQRVGNTEHDGGGSNAVSGMIVIRTPPEGDQIGEVSDIQCRHQDSEEQTIIDFLEQLVRANMCSMALVPAGERKDTIKSIVNDIGLQAPDALRKLSLMIKGGGLE
ncbi:hypothetical protein D9619_001687 [Psilocybe cf. subviscida]|uniref:MIF4G domain-containing protein n=1 Tax=Psilocybe cf. subviscida TaxID=2480587 RepID=A0A8H5BFA6_9AGAR|nr:hypothetical protein D9619_001687 [Psilocybe cf. subviscida]